ncbi:hypothetical protein [Psychrobacillus sp.]|uniref:hypothetical protein n=1 Tax=Psychrobacillus sp. TaxID=1871623 RepID=UPI0028BEA984|nr:hypothetical protein [Psychrobacillus sp.]
MQHYNRDICLFNEVHNGPKMPVNIGLPDSEDFFEQMKELVKYVYDVIPSILSNTENIK